MLLNNWWKSILNSRSGYPSSWLPKKLKSVMAEVFRKSPRLPNITRVPFIYPDFNFFMVWIMASGILLLSGMWDGREYWLVNLFVEDVNVRVGDLRKFYDTSMLKSGFVFHQRNSMACILLARARKHGQTDL